ncbi:MAG: flagellar M-ring protein FliF C-terminal domain-containing protein [Velocimicrobium sp.]
MQERLKRILDQILEFWNKYTSKQKTIIISVVAAIFFTIVLLAYFLSKPKYETILATFDDNKAATELVTLLKDNSIGYKQSRDGKTIYVEDNDYTQGLNLMSTNSINSDDFGWDWATTNSMSTTEKEKKQKILLATQNDLRNYMIKLDGVKDATVIINQPDETYTLFTEEKDTSVSVMLALESEMTKKQAETIANWVSNAVGSENADSVVIMDTDRNLLYSNAAEQTLGGEVSDIEEYKERLKNQFDSNVETMMIKYGFDEAQIASNIVFNFDKVSERYTEYTPADGQEQGLYASNYSYASKGTSGSGGVPGTDSNSESTDYMLDTNNSSDSSVSLDKADYLPNELVRNSDYESGTIEYDNSSMSVVLINYVQYDEAQLQSSGQLSGITFDDFIAQNNVRTKETIDDAEVITLISTATGIAESKISVVAWQQPVFNAKTKSAFDVTNYLMIVLAVLIVALLIFVVFRGTAPMEVTEMEPELSVEQLLATTKENQSLDDIEFSDKTETRLMIEKFVDENPEAVASLLRNWLQDDWGY